ncbi:PIG-L family deacetylase [Streptomyces yunnanensis]|uniref:PIG-L family deacetylase n=1 Tax=Streptomyces yunnanensis TaxID=156453 RepID=A0ABY8AD53_9ACTN|nr:PIG-L family deacetylase [Streptomyces yunnanensis]WEB42893.1 PIG-L family deacetylase [Streptomyces yunnanensis]
MSSHPHAHPDHRPPLRAAHLSILAHPDDDLYFMNPEVLQAIRSGAPTTSVYLTNGESDGRNPRPWEPRDQVPADREAYAKARQNGLLGAYAAMALADRAARWTRSTLRGPHGTVLEMCRLERAPHITLVFLNLRQYAPEDPQVRLRTLWTGQAPSVRTIVPTGGAVEAECVYDRDALIDVLAGLLEHFRPTAVRIMDPDPDHQEHNAQFPQRHDYGDHSDHQDHTYAALFSLEAIERHRSSGTARPFTVTSYRGYYNERWPHNLGVYASSRKEHYLNVYGAADGYDCGDPAGSGDYSVGFGARGTGWVQSTTHRYAGGTDWLRRDAGGRLSAFGVLGGEAVMWQETGPGTGQWGGPWRLGGGPLAPQLSVCATPDGRLHVVGLRYAALGAGADAHRRQLVHLAQTEPGGAFGPWRDLGNPADSADRVRQLGAPVAAVDGQGRLHVFARNWGKGVSSRVLEPAGGWSEWIDLRGSQLQEGLSAAVNHDGRIELFAPARDRVAHWIQDEDGPLLRPTPRFRLSTPAGATSSAVQANGRVIALYRKPERAVTLVGRQGDPGGGWPHGPQSRGGRGGYGPVAATALTTSGMEDCALLATRNDFGGVSCAVLTPDGANWADLDLDGIAGGLIGAPSVSTDSLGRGMVGAIGADAHLYLARQTSLAAPVFSPWLRVG